MERGTHDLTVYDAYSYHYCIPVNCGASENSVLTVQVLYSTSLENEYIHFGGNGFFTCNVLIKVLSAVQC